jgi:hypothetical protein
LDAGVLWDATVENEHVVNEAAQRFESTGSSFPEHSRDTDGPSAVRPTKTRSQSRWRRHPAVYAFGAVEVIAFAVFTTLGRYAWFVGDEYDFLADRSLSSPADLFRPHSEHWTTLPLVVFRLVWLVFGLRTYLPYLAMAVGLHLLAAALLRQVMTRSGIDPWISTIGASVFALFGAGYYNIIYPMQICFTGALVFGLLQMLAADHEGQFDYRDCLGLAFGVAGLMCSGVAVAMTVAVGVAMLARRGWRLALFHTAPLAAIFLIWLAVIGNESAYSRYATPWETLRFAAHVAWVTLVAIGGYGVVAAVFIAMFVAAVLRATRSAAPPRRFALPVALAIGAAVFLLVTGAGRGELPGGYFARGPAESRYLHITAALLLPALAAVIDMFVRRRRMLLPIAAAVFLIGVLSNVDVLVEHTYDARAAGRQQRLLVQLAPRLSIATDLPRSTLVDPPFNLWLRLGWLRDGVRSGRIPQPRDVTAAEAAAMTFSLALRPAPQPVPASRCMSMQPEQPITLRQGESLVVSGIQFARYIRRGLPPSARVQLGIGPVLRTFDVAARSMTVQFDPAPDEGQLQVCDRRDETRG